MATQEKLLKSLQMLKILSSPNQTFDNSKKKDKIQHCHVVTEAISNSTIKIAPNFHNYLSAAIEYLLQLCDDQEADIRMVAEECLNRIIRAMNDINIAKVQIELHKAIRDNGSARTLRAALWRFSQLAHWIRPHKGKPYVVNLFPAMIKMSERPEEQVHETLANSLPKIMEVLGSFASDNEIKALVKAFLKNVLHQSAVIRRTTASSVLTICLNCRKPYVLITYVINYLLDLLLPVSDNQNGSLILGVMTCFKATLPHLKNQNGKQEMNGSFGVRKETDVPPLSIERLLQIYELCLFYLANGDHNVVNSALETLHILLQNCPNDLKTFLLSKNGIGKTRIMMPQSSSLSRLRSPSQLSVATNLASDDLFIESELTETLRSDIEKWIDESKLSVMDVTYARTSTEPPPAVEKGVGVDADSDFSYDYNRYVAGVKSQSIGDNLERLTLSDNSSEKSFSYIEDDKHVEPSEFHDIHVGSFLDKDVPLIYCARLIVKSFLLSGQPGVYTSDKSVRVSVKSLALLCLSSILKIYPRVFLLFLDKNCSGAKLLTKHVSNQPMSDLMLYSSHPDPQLRGVLRVLVANFIRAVLVETNGNYPNWVEQNCDNSTTVSMQILIKILIEGLEDESSNCSRQTLLSLSVCLAELAESSSNRHVLPILDVLPLLSLNPYWLIKVALCELVSKLPYVTIFDITGSSNFQYKIVNNVLFELHKDDDLRVRSAAATAMVNIIPNLYHEHFQVQETPLTSKAIEYKNLYLSNLCDVDRDNSLNRKRLSDNPFPFSKMFCKSCDKVEFSLSKIVTKLYNNLLTSQSRSFICGCIETLSLLSNTYPTTVYTNAWNCFQNESSTEGTNSTVTIDLLNLCINLMKHSVITYDLTCHFNLLNLSSNLYAGYALCLLRPVSTVEPSVQTWEMFSNTKYSNISQLYFNHMIKLLNIFRYVLDEVVPVQPHHSKAVLSNLAPSNTLSPIKRRKSDLEKKIINPGKNSDRDDKERKETTKLSCVGGFVNLPHYMKIYETLRSAYTNYKISLESEACEKFLGLLRQTLASVSVLMEVGTIVEFGGVAEEILNYFRSTFTLEASATVECVQQLLKCLFGTNVTSNINEIKEELRKINGTKSSDNEEMAGFYYNISQKPYNDISLCLNSFKNINKVECDGDSTIMGYLHRKGLSTPVVTSTSAADIILVNYIRIFEPMVILSLKLYTTTSDVQLQSQVLRLLSQLIQLRVNYCLLDSEQVFVAFVLKQFEYIEEGQIPFAGELIPNVFQFLVQLSYSKQHSRSIITIPKIIQLCDGLMASGQNPITHCIPALEPIVEDIFLVRNKSNTLDMKELETTRDVVLAVLLRLSEYSEVIDLIILILDDSKYCSDDPEKWARWSAQVINVILPMLKQNKIRLDSAGALLSLKRLIFVLKPEVFEPIDDVLLLLFQGPLSQETSVPALSRWLAKILVALLVLSPQKEEMLILKISELKADFSPGTIFENVVPTADPLNVMNSADIFHGISSEMIFIKFLFKVINLISKKCVEEANNEEINFLIEEFSMFLVHCLHIFQSGSHCKIANTAISSLNQIQLGEINDNFLQLAPSYPVLTILWYHFLTLLNYDDNKYWSSAMRAESSSTPSINSKIVRSGSIILFCDYMSEEPFNSNQLRWFLGNYSLLLVNLSDEAPVFEFISSIHRNSSISKLFLDSVVANCLELDEPVFKMKLLKCVESTHPDHTGSLLKLLLPKLLMSRQLALSRSVANLASRKIELLLTMPMEDVNVQLPKEDLVEIIKTLVALKLAKKYESLSSLLNKLCTQYYDISPLEFDQKRPVNPDYIKKLQINKSWYMLQIKGKCGDVKLGKETAELLGRLSYDELVTFMTAPDFNRVNFQECIRSGVAAMKRKNLQQEPPIISASVDCLLKEVLNICAEIPLPHQVYNVCGRLPSPQEKSYGDQVTKLYANASFSDLLHDLIPSVTCYMESMSCFPTIKISETHLEHAIEFAVICLESINYLIVVDKINFNANVINSAVNCVDVIFRQSNICNILSMNVHISWLSSAVNSLYKLVEHLLDDEPLPLIPKYELAKTIEDINTTSAGQACYQLYILICWLYKNNHHVNIPIFLTKPIKSIIVSLSRLPLVYSYILIPARVWKSGWTPELTGEFHTQAPPLPIELLQDIDVLQEFIYRITLLGWTTRQQFEEAWMCLLSVLCKDSGEGADPAETNDIVHASALAVKAITSLLLQTLCHPVPGNTNISKLTHVSRDSPINDRSISINKLRSIHGNIASKHSDFNYLPQLVTVFNASNFEKRGDHYSYGQISVKYLLIATKTVEVEENCEASRVWRRREALLENSGLDVNSCLQFLLDFYTQLLKQPSTPLRFLYEVVRSTVTISDLFTDKSQFSLMLKIFFELSKSHNSEDELLHQYLVLGICKAAAVLTPDLETYENIKKLLVQYLKSSLLSSRIACLHGLLYILEGCKLSNISIGGISDELQLILPCAVEYVQCNLNSSNGVLKRSQEHTMLVWALAFYILENVEEIHMETNFVINTLQVAFTLLLQQKPTTALHMALMKKLERLVIVKRGIAERVGKQVVNLALEKLKNDNPAVSMLGKQLLLTYMYTDCSQYFDSANKSTALQTNPDHLVQTIEKVSAIFEHIKRGYVFEIEILCSVLPDILNDFFSPSDILTKVIGEFLSPQQPHPKLLSRVVFQVFERAIEREQLSLLQDWVVFSLSNFTQSLPIGMATWCLTCFFISASSNEWLRLFFPYVQTRVGRYEYEDRKMLCIAGSDFYRNLTNDNQKKTFVANFNKVKNQPDTLFNDLLCSL